MLSADAINEIVGLLSRAADQGNQEAVELDEEKPLDWCECYGCTTQRKPCIHEKLSRLKDAVEHAIPEHTGSEHLEPKKNSA